jgi:hypothetical protein
MHELQFDIHAIRTGQKANQKKENAMKKYIAVHGYKASCEATWAKLGEMAPTISVQMADGVTPARCTFT